MYFIDKIKNYEKNKVKALRKSGNLAIKSKNN